MIMSRNFRAVNHRICISHDGGTGWRRLSKQHREATMKRDSFKTGWNRFLLGIVSVHLG